MTKKSDEKPVPDTDEVEFVEGVSNTPDFAAKPPPPPPPLSFNFSNTPTSITAIANLTLPSGSGSAGVTIGIPSGNLQQISFGYQQGGSGAQVVYSFGPQDLGVAFNHTFDNGATMTVTVNSSPTSSSVGVTASISF